MSITKSTEMLDWTREVRALHADLARPIESEDDPRMAALQNLSSTEGFTPEELASIYFNRQRKQLPVPPIARPEWTESHELYLDDWPHTVGVVFQGKKWVTGDGLQWARLTAHYFVAVDGYTEGDEVRKPGDVWAGDFRVEFCYPEPFHADGTPRQTFGYMTLEGAFQLEIALGDALNVLRESALV